MKIVNVNEIREEAEKLYLNGDFYCSEAIKKFDKPPLCFKTHAQHFPLFGHSFFGQTHSFTLAHSNKGMKLPVSRIVKKQTFHYIYNFVTSGRCTQLFLFTNIFNYFFISFCCQFTWFTLFTKK